MFFQIRKLFKEKDPIKQNGQQENLFLFVP
jgi:hypothetical protein